MNSVLALHRRQAIEHLIKMLNTGGAYERDELFGALADDIPWKRNIIKICFLRAGLVERIGPTTGRPKYRAFSPIDDSPVFVTKCMMAPFRSGDVDSVPPPFVPSPFVTPEGERVEPLASPLLEEKFDDRPKEMIGEPPSMSRPGASNKTDEMLVALIKVVPMMVEAIHRIETKLIIVEKKVDRVKSDLADILSLIPGQVKS